MNWKDEGKKLFWIVTAFLAMFFLPVGMKRFDNAILEAFHLAKWYAQEHVLLCLVPAFFIAGAIAVFISSNSVMKYLGAQAKKVVAYGVASVSGTILAVCSCTVLPLFAGIYRMGAGLGPATAFLYSGPAINVMAIVLTARILGIKLGLARAIGAILFSIIIGLLMQFIFRREEEVKIKAQMAMPVEEPGRKLWQTLIYFFSLVGILIFATWGKPEHAEGAWGAIFNIKWLITSLFAIVLSISLVAWFNVKWWKLFFSGVIIAIVGYFTNHLLAFSTGIILISIITSTENDETQEWFSETWGFAKQILPLLFAGVLVAGAFLGRVGHEGIIPSQWVAGAVGGNSFLANFFASFAGAFMYFATLTEVPILQGLIDNGMGQGPALALLLAGPALSLPNMLVIRNVMGTKKTIVFSSLVIVMATISGMIFGSLF
ncbi:MAG: permease [Candidatus Marinimicrobia bacterium]|nr:permease [Candidatus Neomarinimicrobiota bacterium]